MAVQRAARAHSHGRRACVTAVVIAIIIHGDVLALASDTAARLKRQLWHPQPLPHRRLEWIERSCSFVVSPAICICVASLGARRAGQPVLLLLVGSRLGVNFRSSSRGTAGRSSSSFRCLHSLYSCVSCVAHSTDIGAALQVKEREQ